jgi:hypothetical protein
MGVARSAAWLRKRIRDVAHDTNLMDADDGLAYSAPPAHMHECTHSLAVHHRLRALVSPICNKEQTAHAICRLPHQPPVSIQAITTM